MSNLGTLGELSLLLLVYILVCIIAWKRIWFDPFGGKSLSSTDANAILEFLSRIADR